MCIATCSKDKTIVLYDLKMKQILKTVSDSKHLLAINILKYQSQSCCLISISHEVEANVWAPESLLAKMHIGKLTGHKYAIIGGQFLGEAPYFATLDQSHVINIWDLKSLICIQSVATKITGQQCEGLLAVNKYNLWIFGRKFMQLLASIPDSVKAEERGLEETYPICSCINEYLYSLFVVRKHDI